MGDRTSIECWIPKAIFEARQEEIEGIVWEGFDLNEEGTFYDTVSDEVNYGGSSIVAALVEAKIPFVWQNDSGGSYGAAIAVCDGEKKIEVEIDFESNIYARVDFKDGVPIPDKDDIEVLTMFAAVARSFVTKFGLPRPSFKEFVS